jgi:hypothetical protein
MPPPQREWISIENDYTENDAGKKWESVMGMKK